APTLFTYTTAPQFKELKTSFHYSGEYDGVFDLRFGFEKNTFFIDPCQDMVNEVVVIAIDGSSFAEPLWTRKTGKESPIAQTVYEILQNLARKDRSFYVHFLSCREPELLNINRFTNPKTLDGYLMRKQREFQLPWRGNFISPLVGYWQKRSLAAQKRMIVISNGPVYDCRDFDLSDVFWQHLWFCFNNSYKKYLPQKHITLLKDIKKNVKEKLKVIPRKITRVSLVFENWLPYEWNNPGVILKSDEIDNRTRVFVYEPREETASVILNGLFLTNSPGKTIDYEIEIKEKSGLHTVSGHLPGKKNPILQYHSHVITGQLPEDEWEIWKNFTDEPGNYICPVCYTRHKPMLKCKPLDESITQIIFSSLRRSRGYVILEPHKKQWFIAKTGAKIDDYYFFKMNGSVYVFCPARTSQPRQVKRGSVSMGNRTFYVVE
ncbi:MAG: hypothetical protein JSV88_25685, partial [Candidatus Aminicenantes bacterium]